MIEVNNMIRIYLIVVVIIIMLFWLINDISGHFWNSEESENVANLDFKNIKLLQNPVHLSLTAPIISVL